MSVTIAKCSVGQAESYFESELTSSKVNYYTEQDKQVGDWTGKAAEILGVSGKIEKTDFVKLVKGENPVTGEQMRRRIQPKPQFAKGEWRTAQEIGTHDAVVSAPKSVSIAALIGGDERVIEAHKEAVNAAVKILESEVRANLGAGKTQKTGNAVIAQFHHDTARPDWKNGLVAPQLHTHCVVMNITRTAEGKWKPIDSREMYKSQTFAKSVYYSRLAVNLQQIGYEIEIDEKTNAPEIKGISKEYREACSPRRAEILEQAGGDTANKQHRDAGKFNRRGKVIDRDTVKEQHREIEENFNGAAIKAVEEAKRNERRTTEKISPEQLKGAYERNAKEAVSFALEKLSEREAVFDIREVLKEANKRGIALTTLEAIEQEFESCQAAKKVETVTLGDGKQVVYLRADAERERQLPQHLGRLKPEKSLSEELQEILNTPTNKGEPDKARSASAQEKINNSQKDWAQLSDEQREAVTKIAIAPAGVMTLEGRAGVGKTTTLKFVSTIAEATNYEVLGLAPTTGAAAELEAAGIKAATLQKILQGGEKRAADEQKRFFIVDESSFISSRQMDKFLREAVKKSDRVLFVGDTRQHEAVEAGRPFARIQENKLADGAKIETIRRQRKESDRETVKKLSQGQIVEAIEEMRERGQIQEIKGLNERHLAIVKEFTKEPEKTLVVATRNTDRQQINRQIHEELKHNWQIGEENKTIKVLRARNDLSGAERKFAGRYEAGDIVRYSRGSREHGINAGSQTKVIKIDRENNLLTVETAAGKTTTYDPKRLSGVSVFKEEEIEVCAGERLQARVAINLSKGRGAAKIANGEMLTVERIKGNKIHLATQTGKALTIDAKEALALDYGYATTSHNAQGKTIDRVLRWFN
jgi:conjugative relaxase-like TrwC/TraI family protein